ncbi:DUF4352 domain-containing protein [Streptomyces chitinivorans]|uniref:DUF4352 domain-containing protein n=1 Tax=Streptomyces chitinivorans TaxID=1257027 RepID=A0ABW7HTF3_9ACTN|nr:DUF4352 domain-containing protein [Streptomyces chitinivorans]MDH2412229.1 DUF4352 domain-containing protein [Streptomyces chitinivorans]
MAQHNPGPQYQQQWGPGRPQQPMPPVPQKKSGAGKIIGFGCLGVIALFVVIGVIGAALGAGGEESAEKPAASAAPKEPGGGEEKGEEKPREEPEEEAPAQIQVTAEAADFRPTILADGEEYTSVLVTVVNNSAEKVGVNPLYFEVTAADGSKYDVELAADERQIDTVELAEGEKVTGTVTVKGKIEPKTVTFTDGLFGDSIRADVG